MRLAKDELRVVGLLDRDGLELRGRRSLFRGLIVASNQPVSDLNRHVELRHVLDAGGNGDQCAQERLLVFACQRLVVQELFVVGQPPLRDPAPQIDFAFGMHVPHEADLELLQRHADVWPDHVEDGFDLLQQFGRQRLVADRMKPKLSIGIVYALAAAALFGASTPLSKMLLGSVDPTVTQ